VCGASTVDTSLLSNIQKLFSEKIEIFSPVGFSKVSVLTGIIKISLKVSNTLSTTDLYYLLDTVPPIRIECKNVATVNVPPKMAASSVISV